MGLIDASTNQLLSTLATFGGVQDTNVSLAIPLDFPGRQVQVKVLTSSVPENARYQLEQWFLPVEEETNIKTKLVGGNVTSDGDGLSQIPASFALHQNYPNPFNPSTEIRFDLPEAGNVSLTIYDVLGRQITELVNGVREAGYHSVIWNAADQASGVYLARFSVIDGTGKQVYSKINKLVLMK